MRVVLFFLPTFLRSPRICTIYTSPASRHSTKSTLPVCEGKSLRDMFGLALGIIGEFPCAKGLDPQIQVHFLTEARRKKLVRRHSAPRLQGQSVKPRRPRLAVCHASSPAVASGIPLVAHVESENSSFPNFQIHYFLGSPLHLIDSGIERLAATCITVIRCN